MKSDNKTRVKDFAFPYRVDLVRGNTAGRNKEEYYDEEDQNNSNSSGDHFNGSGRNRENNNYSVKTYLIIGAGIAVGVIIIAGLAIGLSK